MVIGALQEADHSMSTGGDAFETLLRTQNQQQASRIIPKTCNTSADPGKSGVFVSHVFVASATPLAT